MHSRGKATIIIFPPINSVPTTITLACYKGHRVGLFEYFLVFGQDSTIGRDILWYVRSNPCVMLWFSTSRTVPHF